MPSDLSAISHVMATTKYVSNFERQSSYPAQHPRQWWTTSLPYGYPLTNVWTTTRLEVADNDSSATKQVEQSFRFSCICLAMENLRRIGTQLASGHAYQRGTGPEPQSHRRVNELRTRGVSLLQLELCLLQPSFQMDFTSKCGGSKLCWQTQPCARTCQWTEQHLFVRGA